MESSPCSAQHCLQAANIKTQLNLKDMLVVNVLLTRNPYITFEVMEMILLNTK